ncbi:MAG: DUF362 domain-containing protein [Spirochaetales bacterium]|nr:DUF362 domain-containing protein [Spirochaetales bacterium]
MNVSRDLRVSRTKQVVLFSLLSIIIICMFSRTYSAVQLPQSTVAVVQARKARAADLEYSDIKALVAEAVELSGGLEAIVKNGDSVVIKPNLVIMETVEGPLPPEVNGITTDYRVVRAIVELVREINPDGTVYVMEGSAYPTRPVMEQLRYNHDDIPGTDGILAIEEDSGGWQDFDSPGIVQVELPNGRLNTSYYMNRKYYEADVLISVPTLKNHSSACITGALKNVGIGGPPANIYGTAEDDPLRLNMVSHFSADLHAWIHDWNLCKPIDFVVMDGLQGFQNGPGQAEATLSLEADQMNMRLILAGTDAVAVDTVEAFLIGWDPGTVPHLTYLNSSSAGNIDASCITVKGARVMDVKKKFAGTRPWAGGSQITDTTPPSLDIASARFENGMLNMSLAAGQETVKAEVYIDGGLRTPVIKENFDSITVNAAEYLEGDHIADIFVYDKYLNHSSASISFNASSGEISSPPPSGTETPAPETTVVPSLAPTGIVTGERGDVNGSGTIDIVDALLTAQFYVGLDPANFDEESADADCNGSVNIIDALLIAQYYVGLIEGFCQ